MKWKIWLLAIIGSMALLVSSPAWSDETLDVNTATVEQLQAVKGIGPKLAAAIVEYRNAHGKFRSIEELTEVKGIGSKKLEKIRGHLRVGTPEKSGVNEKKTGKDSTG
ncbi:MAG TPA: helix-hairpin-helix domain-containing protein [Mariprofundaceae bacterium]|nr:helix-hairpin-helix domain-containing protein [Mariprofundaceae bacterium]